MFSNEWWLGSMMRPHCSIKKLLKSQQKYYNFQFFSLKHLLLLVYLKLLKVWVFFIHDIEMCWNRWGFSPSYFVITIAKAVADFSLFVMQLCLLRLRIFKGGSLEDVYQRWTIQTFDPTSFLPMRIVASNSYTRRNVDVRSHVF